MKLRDVLLKMIPYLLSVAGGLLLFVLTKDNISNENVADLINNIAASLLAIPLVFLLYDYSNSRVSKRLSQTMAQNLGDTINLLVMNLILVMRRIADVRGPVTLESVNKMSDWRPSYIARRLKITSRDLDELRKYRDELNDLIYKYARANILTTNQIQDLSAMARDLSHLINEHGFYANKQISSKYVAGIVTRITDWLDTDAEMSLHFQEMVKQGLISVKNK